MAYREMGWSEDNVLELLDRLEQSVPEADTELIWHSPFELLIATILSAQTTDARVNQTTPGLWKRYPTPEALAAADPGQIEKILQPLGFFRQKTKAILGAANMIVEEYGGEVPRRMEDLIRLPGVGRKTAAVVLGTAFGIQEGIFVDTHMRRVSFRLGLTRHQDPDKIERDLMAIIPQKEWTRFGHRMVLHGRYVCTARNPKCPTCALEPICPKNGVGIVRS